MTRNRKPELLAPAGDLAGLRAALRFGADAVYAGGPMLQLRAASAGFTLDTLHEAADIAHRAGKRLYVTVNSFVKSSETRLLASYARELHALGADAAIVSDLGAIAAMHEACPALDLHVSTQANCMNDRAASVYYALGAKRVVLARELSLSEIRLLRTNTPPELELEAFVHGAMCMAYSGRCLLSAFLADRSGNRGACAQSCRWSYRLQEEKRPNEYYDIAETKDGSYILSSFDLNASHLLGALSEAGVCSFKLEGRMKSEFYIAGVTNAYRMAIDGTAAQDAIDAELDAVSHRPYCTGFYEGPVRGEALDGAYQSSCRYVGRVVGGMEADGYCTVEAKNRFYVGETLELLSPGTPGRPFRITSMRNESGDPIDGVNCPRSIVRVAGAPCAGEGDFLRKRGGRDA